MNSYTHTTTILEYLEVKEMKIVIDNAEESLTKTVKQSGNGGYVYIPSRWIGREVEVILLPEDTEVDCVFQWKGFNLKVQFEFGEDSDSVLYWGGLDWVEHLSQVHGNESFQDNEVQEDYETFIEKIEDVLKDPMTFQWAYDLEKGESHTFENGIRLFKQF